MKKRFSLCLALAAAFSAFAGASSASAATEFGSHCIADGIEPEMTAMTIEPVDWTLPPTAPAGGIITQISETQTALAELGPTVKVPQVVKVLHPTGAQDTYTVSAEATIEVHYGANTVPVRMPVQAGDRLAEYGLPFSDLEPLTLVCAAGGSQIGLSPGNLAQGASLHFENGGEGELPLAARVEPDANGDGYGDETQEPTTGGSGGGGGGQGQNAPSPVAVSLTATATAKKTSVAVSVIASATTSATVGGSANLGKGKSAPLNGGSQALSAGTPATFTVPFPAALKSKLKQTPTSKKLTLNISVTAPGAASKALTVKAKGQKKTKKKHKKS